MYKAILFDFDGVLTTDATGSYTTCKYISEATGIEYDKFSQAYLNVNYDLLYGVKRHEEVWDDICQAIGKEIDSSVLARAFVATPIDKDMLDLACELKASGYYTGIVTDNKKDRLDVISEQYGFNDIFDCIAISSVVGSGKKDKDIFEYILTEIGVSAEECIFIDNSQKNLVIPRDMGMMTFYYDHIKRDTYQLEKYLVNKGIERINANT